MTPALARLLSLVLVEIRHLARGGHLGQIEALADLFHNLPTELSGEGRLDLELLETEIRQYQQRFPGRGPDWLTLLREVQSDEG